MKLISMNSKTLVIAQALALLGSGLAVVACDEPTVTPTPVGTANPDPLEFGLLSVAQQRTEFIEIENIGNGPLRVSDIRVRVGDPNVFSIGELPQELRDGLRQGQSSTVAITYTPCPAAVDPATGERNLDALPGCTVGLQTATVDVIDNSADGGFEFDVTGDAARPPNPSIRCDPNPGRVSCGSQPDSSCNILSFSTIDAAEGVCDRFVSVRNSRTEQGEDVAPLEITGSSLLLLKNNSQPVDGSEVVFELLDADTLMPPQFPFRVEASAAGPGEKTFILRLDPQENGSYNGTRQENGLVFFTNNPVQPEQRVSVLAEVAAPEVSITSQGFEFPCGSNVRFRDVTSGEMESQTFSIQNVSAAQVRQLCAELETGDTEFSLAPAEPERCGVDLEASVGFIDVVVTYAPTDDEEDSDRLLVTFEGQAEACALNLAGGQTPEIDVSPRSLQFTSSGGQEECRDLTVTNVGDATLVVDRLKFEPVDAEQGLSDDFRIAVDGCADTPTDCTTRIEVAPSDPDSTDPGDSAAITICYENDDASFQDQVNLDIYSNDPFRSPLRVSQSATDRPCLPPSIVVDLDPPNPRVGRPVALDLNASVPGGPGGTDAEITRCSFEIRRGDRNGTFNPNPLEAPPGSGASLETVFTPASARFHEIGITCTNTCGAESVQVERFTVSD